MGVTAQLFLQEHGVPTQPDFPNRKLLLDLLIRILPDLKKPELNKKLLELAQTF